MRGSTNAPGVSVFDLSDAIEGLAKQIMQGTVTTPLETADGKRLCSSGDAVIEARQVQKKRGVDITDEVSPIVRSTIEAAVEASERRIVDGIMGALMSGKISSTLANHSGATLATRRGETISAHQRISDSMQQYDSQTAGLFLLFERMTANHISTR